MLVKISTMFGEIKICFHLRFDWHFFTLLNFTKIKNGLLLYHFLFHFRSKKLIIGGTNFICTTAICFNNLYHSEMFNIVEGRGTSSRVGQYISPHATHMCLVLLLPWLPIRTLFTLLLPCHLAMSSLLLFTVLLRFFFLLWFIFHTFLWWKQMMVLWHPKHWECKSCAKQIIILFQWILSIMKHQWLEWRKNRVRLNKSKAVLRLKNDAVVYTTTTTEST